MKKGLSPAILYFYKGLPSRGVAFCDGLFHFVGHKLGTASRLSATPGRFWCGDLVTNGLFERRDRHQPP
jgi:hypothetical protein